MAPILLGLFMNVSTAQDQRHWEVKVPEKGKTGFTLLPSGVTGITFTNILPEERHLTNQILLNGSGVAAGDVDGDGWCDLFFCGLGGHSALYRNLGNWKFQNITASAGLQTLTALDATGAAFADVDGDGDLDLIVNSLGGGTHVFFNDGKGHFSESAQNAGMNAKMGGTSLALGDLDGNGTLDLYVANYRTVTIRDQPNTRFAFRIVNGKPEVTTIDGRSITEPDLANRFDFHITLGEGQGNFAYDENGEPHVLYLNDGAGHFTPVSWTSGTFLDEQGQPLAKPLFDWGLSVMFRDLNGDGAPDIYVCNDFRSPDRIWINDGRGHFHALAPLAIRQTSLSAMGLDIADLNRDGYDDIFELDMLSRDPAYRQMQRIDIRPEVLPIGAIDNRPQFSRNMLQLNRGDGTYAEIAQYAGLEAAEWAWMPVFLDVDLDGYEDLLIPTGFERDNMNVDALRQIETLKKQRKMSTLELLHLRTLFPRLDTASLAFRNLGNLKFEDKSADWGFNTRGVAQGMALADLDNDGDLDVVINCLNGPARIFRNESSAPRVGVRLRGKAPNTRGIGAKIRFLGGPVPQSQEMIAGGRYLSCDEAMRVFACGPAAGGMTIEVTWRSGQRSVVTNVTPNRIYEVDENGAMPALSPPPSTRNPQPLFKDISELLHHSHHEEPFDDFARQPMLSRRLSQLGPGLSWFDVDGDGWDDLIIGSGRGGQLAIYRNDGRGGFQPMQEPWLAAPVARDQTTILGCSANGRARLLAGSANYEDGLTNSSMVRQYDFAGKTVKDMVADQAWSCGPMALADVNGDGNLDLFVGGRVIAGRYGEPASAILLLGRADGTFAVDAENTRRVANVGMVSGAVFSDLNGDGYPELILACDWGPIRVFQNDKGKFTETTEALGLSKYLGWWNGVTTGDFDGDGRLDIVASNWGQNTKYEYFRKPALHLFAGDVDGNGTVELIEAYFNPTMKKLAPIQSLHLIRAAIPLVGDRVNACGAYARMDLEQIYADALKGLREWQANGLETMVFLNRGTSFEARVLPPEAQFAPAFAICVGDLDGDGNEDIFLSQNFFAFTAEISRCDAGRGLWLRGDGQGNFKPVPGQESGVTVYGEQRGAALCDFDGDGRVDLAVSQNAAGTKLYQNVGARPGLRVRLAGPPGNALGIGATIRLLTGERPGPAREIHAGSGYWSQDSAVQVLGSAEPPTRLWVRWPGGKGVTIDLPPVVKEVTVDTAGKIVQSR